MGSYQTAVNPAVLELDELVQALSDPVPAEFVRDFQVSTVHRGVPDAFLARVVAESLKLPARVWQAACAGILAAGSNGYLHRIEAPTFIVWGDRDAFFLREQQERLHEAIQGSALVIYPETGHALHWERPERFARDLESFMATEVQRWESSSSIMSQSW
jgi:pimeloyl-ACP methyl ester carboxylesterase